MLEFGRVPIIRIPIIEGLELNHSPIYRLAHIHMSQNWGVGPTKPSRSPTRWAPTINGVITTLNGLANGQLSPGAQNYMITWYLGHI